LLERRPWTQRLNRQLPLRFRDVLPQPPLPLPPAANDQLNVSNNTSSSSTAPVSENPPSSSLQSRIRTLGDHIRRVFTTQRNHFGLFRRYHAEAVPSHDPEEHVLLEDLCNVPAQAVHLNSAAQSFYPYPNLNSFRLGHWYWNGGVQKSQKSFRELLGIVSDPGFHSADVRDVNWDQINKKLASEGDDAEEWLDEDAGWTQTPVTIPVPFHSRRGIPMDPQDGPQDYVVTDFYHRSLVSVIREKLANPVDDPLFHYEPYELNWQPPAVQHSERVHGELYTSAAFLNAHRDLQESPAEPGCELPRVILALMFWSDGTHLTSFGDAKCHPLYMYFGNESKYRRCKPSCHLCNHVAYFQKICLLCMHHCMSRSHHLRIPKLPAAFKDFATKQTAGGKSPNSAFMAHCHRELMHAQWKILLDDEFIDAWEHGIVITCCDGITRRFYPRIFTYSADYMEK